MILMKTELQKIKDGFLTEALACAKSLIASAKEEAKVGQDGNPVLEDIKSFFIPILSIPLPEDIQKRTTHPDMTLPEAISNVERYLSA